MRKSHRVSIAPKHLGAPLATLCFFLLRAGRANDGWQVISLDNIQSRVSTSGGEVKSLSVTLQMLTVEHADGGRCAGGEMLTQ